MLGSLLGGSVCQAGIVFNVTLDTSPLNGHPAGPFALDFQLTDGSGGGDGNNTAVVKNFNFHGGSWSGPASVSLTDNAFWVDFSQGFTAGTSLSFTVSLTTSVDAGGTPDRFSFALLDASGGEIPTVGIANEFLGVDLSSPNPTIESYYSDGSLTDIVIGAPGVTVVPEPQSTLGVALLCGLGALSLAGRRMQGSLR